MASGDHLAILRQGVEAWNRWRREHADIKPDLNGAYLSGAYLRRVNLSRAYLIEVDLSGASLTGANLSNAYLVAANLSGADIIRANFYQADLNRAILSGADLRQTNLAEASLIQANFSRTNLSGATLTQACVLGTNFTAANFTAACLRDWMLNNTTQLEGTQCDYFYLQNGQQQRCPHTGNFASGEFLRRFQPTTSMMELVFGNGINWEAFAYAFRQLQKKSGTTALSIQRIETQGQGDILLRIGLPTGIDSAEMQQFVKLTYDAALSAIEEKYQTTLQIDKRQIKCHHQHSANLWEMVQWIASQSIRGL